MPRRRKQPEPEPHSLAWWVFWRLPLFFLKIAAWTVVGFVVFLALMTKRPE